jgi:hypothetical protein
MIWMVLTPREEERIMRPVLGDNYNAQTVKMVQSKVTRAGSASPELELTEEEYQRVRRCRRDWKSGYERELQAVLDAAARHP